MVKFGHDFVAAMLDRPRDEFGRFVGDGGGGGGIAGHMSDADISRARDASTPSGAMSNDRRHEILSEAGHSEEAIRETDEVLNMLSDTGAQEAGREKLEGHLNAQDEVGKCLEDQIDLESALLDEYVTGANERVERKISSLRADAEAGLLEEFDPSLGDDLDEFINRERRIEKRKELHVGRKGEVGETSSAESWSTATGGADFGSGAAGYDVKSRLDVVRDKMDYDVLGGLGKMMGAPGEAEITFIKRSARGGV